MEKYHSDVFIEKYVEKVKSSAFDSKLNEMRTKINRLLIKENFYFNDECYFMTKDEDGEDKAKICNFFVIPTHSLYFDDGEKIHEAGISVELYSRISDEKYKRILVNLSDEVIDNGNWLNATYIDRDFFDYIKDSHRHLRIALKLSSRIIKDKAKKVFYNDEWLEDDEALEHIDEYRRVRKMLPLLKFGSRDENEANQQEDIDAIQFLKAQSQYIASTVMLSFPDEPFEDVKEWGWESDDYYYLQYTKTWSWIREQFNRNGIQLKTDEKELDDYLIKAGVFESNEKRPKSVLKRADRNVPQIKPRVFMINKVRFSEFLLHKENGR